MPRKGRIESDIEITDMEKSVTRDYAKDRVESNGSGRKGTKGSRVVRSLSR